MNQLYFRLVEQSILNMRVTSFIIRILILWKLWNLPANKVKRGDFDCNSSLSLFHNEGTKSNAKAQNVLKQRLSLLLGDSRYIEKKMSECTRKNDEFNSLAKMTNSINCTKFRNN